MVHKLYTFFCLSILLSLSTVAREKGDVRWTAQWIAPAMVNSDSLQVCYFRKSIHLDKSPTSFLVHVSADSRYKLYVDGKFVVGGPASSDDMHWNYETIDLAPFLTKGKNVLTALVWHFGQYTPQAQVGETIAFLMQGQGKNEELINTDSTWKVLVSKAYHALPVSPGVATDIGSGEFVDFNAYPAGWQSTDFDDRAWPFAQLRGKAYDAYSVRNNNGKLLAPRSIPFMSRDSVRLKALRKNTGRATYQRFPAQRETIFIPANTAVTMLLDQGELINAYPVLMFGGGKGAEITLTYAEALYDKNGLKGNRNEVDERVIKGFQDKIIGSGQEMQQFETLWWRTYRYVQVHIKTKENPLELLDFYGIKTGYPFQLRAKFSSDNPLLDQLLTIGWRTATLCASDTYMDCPYYERLQYAGDTRIQGLVSIYNSGDSRLLRRAIEQLNNSRNAAGLTQSRYPTRHYQYIPPFSLVWIGMVYDYWMYCDDSSFVRRMLPGIQQTLSFFENYQRADGTLQRLPFWSFTDWVDKPGWDFGVPPIDKQGNSSILDLQLLLAIQYARKITAFMGLPDQALNYEKQEIRLKKGILSKYWVESKGLLADDAAHRYFSQHANTLAVLTDLVAPERRVPMMKQILQDSTLAQASIYFRYYVHAALQKAGMAGQYLDQLSIWYRQMQAGLTTWAEISDVSLSRSDCHAWGASPNIEIYRMVLGIESVAPGFRQVYIKPNLGSLQHAEGRIPHPAGELMVAYKKKEGKWYIKINLPKGVTGTFEWQSKQYTLQAMNSFVLPE